MGGAGAQPVVCATWVANVEEMDAWLKRACRGDRFVYCTGPGIVRGPAAARAASLYAAGLVELYQPQARHCLGYDYTIERTGKPLPGMARTGVAGRVGGGASRGGRGAPELDAAAQAILVALRRSANLGLKCPSDTELARVAGLPTRNAAAWRLRKLIEAGAIRSDTIDSGPEAGWRTVTILDRSGAATGKRTALPPSLRGLQADIAREAE